MRFFLDGNPIINEPVGDVITSIKRDQELGGFLVTNDAQLKWNKDGYDYIQSVIESEGFCGEIDCLIEDECLGVRTTIFTGKIFILTIQKNSNCIITAALNDNSYQARINKNKSIKIFIDTVKSKNNVDITASAQNRITMFDPDNGGTLAATRMGYRVYDALKNMVAFMSDDEVDFDSTLFGPLGEFEGLSLMLGQEIAFPTGENPIQESFDSIFREIRKKVNCTFYIDATGQKPVLRIEKYGDLFINTVVKKLENVDSVNYKVDAKKLVATVSVGSKIINDIAVSPTISFVEDNVYQTYKTEDYTLLEQCNRDERLDLVSDYIISSNAIQELAITPTPDKWSENIFFIDCNNVVANGVNYTSDAIAGDPFGTGPPVFYNTRLMNNEVLERWRENIPNSITGFKGTINSQFRASNITITNFGVGGLVISPFQFSDDFNSPNFDGDGVVNNYGNGTAQGTPVSAANSRYTCPFDGQYVLFATFRCVTAPTPSNASITIEFIRRNAGGGIVQISSSGVIPVVGTVDISHFDNFMCDATDFFTLRVTGFSMDIYGTTGETYFLCSTAPDSQGTFVFLNNQDNIPIVLADIEYPIKNADFYDIIANPFGKIAFTYPKDKIQSAWIDTFKYNHMTSMANMTLLGTQELLK